MAKISDFGMSKQLTASLQAFKTFQGTFMYMSPERLKGEEHGFDSDIWSLGVSIAECAIGRFPFDLERMLTYSF
jgi:serine/threonine protein kinase